jgi:L,D-peptidoglycan transpeptidase YkuD (ErfK/YbiS/YcfS/YnhG family)
MDLHHSSPLKLAPGVRNAKTQNKTDSERDCATSRGHIIRKAQLGRARGHGEGFCHHGSGGARLLAREADGSSPIQYIAQRAEFESHIRWM